MSQMIGDNTQINPIIHTDIEELHSKIHIHTTPIAVITPMSLEEMLKMLSIISEDVCMC